MKNFLFASAATLVGSIVVSDAAQAAEAQIVTSVSIAQNDTQYGYFSYRRAFGDDLKNGLGYRFDVSRSTFGFLNGAVATDGTTDTARLLLTYGTSIADFDTTFFGGVSYKDKSFSPGGATLNPLAEFGGFFGFEASQWASGAGGLQLLAEYETQETSFFARGTYLFELGAIEMGPTVHYLSEKGGYDRRGAGVWVNYFTGNGVTLYGAAYVAEGGTAVKIDQSAIEFGATFDF